VKEYHFKGKNMFCINYRIPDIAKNAAEWYHQNSPEFQHLKIREKKSYEINKSKSGNISI